MLDKIMHEPYILTVPSPSVISEASYVQQDRTCVCWVSPYTWEALHILCVYRAFSTAVNPNWILEANFLLWNEIWWGKDFEKQKKKWVQRIPQLSSKVTTKEKFKQWINEEFLAFLVQFLASNTTQGLDNCLSNMSASGLQLPSSTLVYNKTTRTHVLQPSDTKTNLKQTNEQRKHSLKRILFRHVGVFHKNWPEIKSKSSQPERYRHVFPITSLMHLHASYFVSMISKKFTFCSRPCSLARTFASVWYNSRRFSQSSRDHKQGSSSAYRGRKFPDLVEFW